MKSKTPHKSTSRQPVAVRGHGTGGGLLSSGSSPSSSSPVLRGGRIVMSGNKPSRRMRTVRVPVALSPRILDAWVEVPIVRDEIEFQRRVVLVKAALAMKASGISQNKAAKALEIPGSLLSLWLTTFSNRGEEGLRPKPWNGGKKPANGQQSRGNAFLAIKIK